MKKRLTILLLGVCAAAPAFAEVDRAQLIGLSASVLKIEADRAQGGYSLGSGVAIAPDRVVTNCHVTRDAVRVNVLRGGARWPAVSQLRDVEHDLCLLRVPGLQARIAAPAPADRLKPGQPVAALGYTGGLTLQHSAGEVIALHRLDGARVIQSSNWFNSGASGGGLFDEALNLVGILTFRLRGGEVHYFAAPAAWLAFLLERPIESYEAVAPDQSQALPYWQQTIAKQPRFLRADLMERDERWPELEMLAIEWTRADAGDPEPWYLLGMALQRMDQLPRARQALECSLAIEPGSIAARELLELLLPKWPDSTAPRSQSVSGPAGIAAACAAGAASLPPR